MPMPGFLCTACGKPTVRVNRLQKYCPDCSSEKHAAQKDATRGTKERSKSSQAEERKRQLASVIPGESIAWDPSEGPQPHRLVRVAIPFTYKMSKNATWSMGARQGHVFIRKEIKVLRQELATRISLAIGDQPFLEGRLWIDIMVEKPDHRGDAINMLDGICDSVKVATGVDDRWYSVRRLDWRVVKASPRIIIGISQEITEPERVCSYCGGIKPLSTFAIRKHGANGRARVCPDCTHVDERLGSRMDRAKRGYVRGPYRSSAEVELAD